LKDEGRSCIGIDNEFQSWMRKNKDNLPSDIQEKVDAGELTIEPADE